MVHLAMAEKRYGHAEEKGGEERHGCRMAVVRCGPFFPSLMCVEESAGRGKEGTEPDGCGSRWERDCEKR